ncbi:MAG TPA: class I SAM-dependent methyltransferase [Edaphobacter sp.]
MRARREHWESVYRTKAANAVSWYRRHLEVSLALIKWAASSKRAAILDIGGGASTLVDDLVAEGFGDLTVLDIAEPAIELARLRMGESANSVRWVTADFLDSELEPQRYDVCHDRAVFHFLTDAAEQQRYFDQVDRVLRPKGTVIVSTFAMDGPERCSGLVVSRYNEDVMRQVAGERFEIAASQRESHHTPSGSVQEMMYFVLRRPPMPQ